MQSKYFKVLSVVLVLAVMAAIGVSQTVKRAQMRGEGMFGGGMPGPMLGYFVRKLDLTEAQQAQVKSIMAKEKPSFQPLMLQMAQGHQQMHELVMNNGFDEAKVRELATQQTQTMTELMVQRARVESELLQILTPDQKTKLTALAAAHQQRLLNHLQNQGQTQPQ